MIKVGVLFEYGSLNGGEHSMLAAMSRLHKVDVEFVALLPLASPLHSQLQQMGISCLQNPLYDESGQRLASEEFAAKLISHCLRSELQLLHANSLTMGRHLGRIASHLNIPTSSHIRDMMSLKKSAIRDLNTHSLLLAVSDATASYHIEQGIDQERIQRLYNGIDSEVFKPGPKTKHWHRTLNLPEEARLVATVGQICLRKGQTDLAEAAVLLKDQFPDVHYLIVGERHSTKQESIEFDQRIDETFNNAGIGDRLHRLGYVNDMPQLYREIDLLVHPAKQEPLGRVLLEAGACETPIVATNVGGTSEIIRHHETGILVPPASPVELAEAMAAVLTAPDQARQRANKSRREICDRFHLQSHSVELVAAWKRVIADWN